VLPSSTRHCSRSASLLCLFLRLSTSLPIQAIQVQIQVSSSPTPQRTRTSCMLVMEWLLYSCSVSVVLALGLSSYSFRNLCLPGKVYGSYLVFQLFSHKSLYDDDKGNEDRQETKKYKNSGQRRARYRQKKDNLRKKLHMKPSRSSDINKSSDVEAQASAPTNIETTSSEDEVEQPNMSLAVAIALLGIVTVVRVSSIRIFDPPLKMIAIACRSYCRILGRLHQRSDGQRSHQPRVCWHHFVAYRRQCRW
jgi:hypothetical protein